MQIQAPQNFSKIRFVLAGLTLFIASVLITVMTRVFIAQYLPEQITTLGVARAVIEVALKLSLAAIPVIFILFLHREPLEKFGITWGKTPIRHLVIGASTAFLWLLLDYLVLLLALGSTVVTSSQWRSEQWAVWLFWFVHLLFFNSVGEEIQSRAYLQTVFSRATGTRRGVAISALFFGLGHIPINVYIYGSSQAATLFNVAGAALFGLVAGYLFAVTGNILASISLHSVWNVMQACLPWQIDIPSDVPFTLYVAVGLASVVISFIILALLILLHKYKPNWLRKGEAH